MPSWNIHLEAGHRLNQKLKFSGQNQKEFLLGCILPDINNGYINNVKTSKPHEDTHFAYDQKSSLNFYAKYKTEIDNKIPIFIGYLFHLYTDGFFNYEFYRTIKHDPLGQNLTHDQKHKIKHHDFWIYDNKFNHQLNLSPKEIKELVLVANQIDSVNITTEDLEDIEKIFKSGILKLKAKEPYLFYTEQKLDTILDDMIKSFTKDYLGE